MRSFHFHDFITGFVLTCFAFFQFDTLFFVCFPLFFKPACINFSSCPFHEGILCFGSLICAVSLGKEPSTSGLKTPGPEGGTVVAVTGQGELSFLLALPKRRAVLAVCLLHPPSNLVQKHWWPPKWKGLFERCRDLPHELLSKSWSLSIWRLLETIFR